MIVARKGTRPGLLLTQFVGASWWVAVGARGHSAIAGFDSSRLHPSPTTKEELSMISIVLEALRPTWVRQGWLSGVSTCP